VIGASVLGLFAATVIWIFDLALWRYHRGVAT
jgi:hypothetical protein